MAKTQLFLPVHKIESRILFLRGERVLLDADLAELYGETTKRLNQQVTRNKDRFPEDFMFRLSKEEKSEVVANCNHLQYLKFSPTLPYAFTEHGAIMAANVLRSKRAIAASIYVVRAFVTLRGMLLANRELAEKVAELERKFSSHDGAIRELIEAIRRLMAPEVKKERRPMGFRM